MTLTFGHEEYLPDLPVPNLQDTLAKWTRSLRPLLTKAELARAEAAAVRFAEAGGLGEQLQGLLVAHAAENRNWLEAFWDNAAYLDARYPNAINTNWGVGFLGSCPDLPAASDAVNAAAAAAAAMALFYDQTVLRGDAEPEKVRRKAISMFQVQQSSLALPI